MSNQVDKLLDSFRQLGLEPEAIAEAEKLLHMLTPTEEGWIEIAARLRHIGSYHAAFLTYKVALEQFPGSARLWGNRGILLRQWGRFDEAIESLQHALALKPDYAHAIESLAHTYELKQDFASAIGWYTAAINAGRGAEAWNNMGNCYASLGSVGDAFACYERALALDPNHADTLFNWAAHLAQNGRPREALEKIEAYLVKRPQDDEARALRDHIISSPNNPKSISPASLMRDNPIVVRPFTNVDYDGTITAPNLNEKQVIGFEKLRAMTREQAAAIVGPRAWDVLHVWDLVKEFSDHHPLPQHPRIFLAYRWEGDEHERWVERLATELDIRGYDVVFDRFAEREREKPSAREFISRLGMCQIFVPILTELYRRRVEPGHGAVQAHLDDGWAFDEYQIALMLAQVGRLSFTGIWRSGPAVPLPFTEHNVLDFRDNNMFDDLLERHFPRRFVAVVGIRDNDTFRVRGPLRYSQVAAAVEEFRSANEFVKITLIDKIAD